MQQMMMTLSTLVARTFGTICHEMTRVQAIQTESKSTDGHLPVDHSHFFETTTLFDAMLATIADLATAGSWDYGVNS